MLFGKKECQHCHQEYDEMERVCPNCHTKDPDNTRYEKFNNMVWASWPRELVLFLVGLLALDVIASIVMAACSGNNMTDEGIMMLANSLAYVITLVLLIIVSYKYFREYLKSFTNWRAYVSALIAAIILIAFSLIYSLLINLGYETDGNTNQTTVNSLVELYPFFSIVIFGLVGPLVEEMTYRVGLFSLCRRINRWVAYLIVAVVFALIHFDFTTLWSGNSDSIINELINLPSYIFAGLVFSYIYEKYGFASTFVAHALNNLFSIIFILV
ncbi:MAG: CPBP family intramembrane metalloprotease [Coprobacillus sp.]|nr:CPBP family intramembrane metalloprotease [Coprobacillus sp.]